MTYNLRITRPAPSMSQDRTVFEAASYWEAVNVARAAWRAARRTVTLGSGEYGMENWHYIDVLGIETDRNTNSGVLAKSRVLEQCEACDLEIPDSPCTCTEFSEASQ